VTTCCRHPDRDVPKLLCGYPLPCPYHTAVIDLTADPVPTVTIPLPSDAARAIPELKDIVRALSSTHSSRPKKRKKR
jgi:hypothetical protein